MIYDDSIVPRILLFTIRNEGESKVYAKRSWFEFVKFTKIPTPESSVVMENQLFFVFLQEIYNLYYKYKKLYGFRVREHEIF